MLLNIGYFADGSWSYLAFEKLIKDKDISISFICVRYDTMDTTLKNYCDEYDITYLKHQNINSEEFIKIVAQYNCDIFVSMSFNQIFKQKIMNLPRYKTINCHAGKLPFYRGRNILNWALINDEKEFGITVHYIDDGIDTGDIILQKSYAVTDNDNYASLLEKAYVECANILYDALVMFKKGFVKGQQQSKIHPFGFYCTQRKTGDEQLNWKQTSREIFNFVRAICKPGPMARATLHNKEMKINKIEFIDNAPHYKCITGAILQKIGKEFIVKTEDSFIKVVEYEYDGTFRVGDRFDV